MTTTATALEQLRRRVRTEHAIRVRTVLDLVAADCLAEGIDVRLDVVIAFDALGINLDAENGAAHTYAVELLDLDNRRRYLTDHGSDAVDAYLTEEELAAALKAHHGDKGALRDRMLEDVEDQLAELILESCPGPPATYPGAAPTILGESAPAEVPALG